MTATQSNSLLGFLGIERLAEEVDYGDTDSMLITLTILYGEAWSTKLSDRQVAMLWVPLRLAIPRLVGRAIDGDMQANQLLHLIRRHLDPYIDVPWRYLPHLDQADLDGPPDNGVDGYALLTRLKQVWDDAMARAIMS